MGIKVAGLGRRRRGETHDPARQEVQGEPDQGRTGRRCTAWPRPSTWSSRLASAKFDETVELAVRLGVDPRKADQIVRGTLSLPSGTGRTERVAVFAAGEAAAEARAAGADEVGADDLVAKINGGFLDFDVAIATPDLMGQVGTLGRVLGPRGLMPNPKTGTVTTDVGKAVAEFKGGRVEYRTDKVGNIHIRVGKASFTAEQLVANIRAVVDELQRAKPPVGQGSLLPVGHRVDHHGPRASASTR